MQPYYYKTNRFQYKTVRRDKKKALCIDEGINPTGRCVCIIKGYAPNARAHNLFKTNANKSKEKNRLVIMIMEDFRQKSAKNYSTPGIRKLISTELHSVHA